MKPTFLFYFLSDDLHFWGHTLYENKPFESNPFLPGMRNFLDTAVAQTSASAVTKYWEIRDRKKRVSFVKMFKMKQKRLSSWHVPDIPTVDVLIFLIGRRRQAVRAAAVLFLNIDPSLRVEHLVPSPNCCRKHWECWVFLRLCFSEIR